MFGTEDVTTAGKWAAQTPQKLRTITGLKPRQLLQLSPHSFQSHLIRAEKNYYVEFSFIFFVLFKVEREEISRFLIVADQVCRKEQPGHGVVHVSRAHDSGVNNFISRGQLSRTER